MADAMSAGMDVARVPEWQPDGTVERQIDDCWVIDRVLRGPITGVLDRMLEDAGIPPTILEPVIPAPPTRHDGKTHHWQPVVRPKDVGPERLTPYPVTSMSMADLTIWAAGCNRQRGVFSPQPLDS